MLYGISTVTRKKRFDSCSSNRSSRKRRKNAIGIVSPIDLPLTGAFTLLRDHRDEKLVRIMIILSRNLVANTIDLVDRRLDVFTRHSFHPP